MASDQGMADLVTIHEGSATDFPLDAASVIFLFLPKALVPIVLESARAAAKPGTRILAHEQHQIHTVWKPDRRTPVMAENALTVAHIWTVD